MTDNIENQDDTENNEVEGVNPFLTSEETAKKQLKNSILKRANKELGLYHEG